jgi:hypothetical protein
MALIKTCRKCGKTTDRPPYTEHKWIDYTCFKCGGEGHPGGSYTPYIPKQFPKFMISPSLIPPQRNLSIVGQLKQSIRCVA